MATEKNFSQYGMNTYLQSITIAKRWQKVVDFGSPVTAWTPEMLAQKREELATKKLKNDTVI